MRRVWSPVVLLVLAAGLAGCTDFDETGRALGIHGIDVQAKEVRAGSITLEIATTIDNLYGRSGELELNVKAYDEATGMLLQEKAAAVGELPKDRSHVVPVTMELARQDAYRFEVQVIEDGRIVQTGRVTASNLDALPTTVHETGLRVGQVDVEVRGVEAKRAELRLTTYISNEGAGASRPLQLQMRVRDLATSIVAAEAWEEVPAVAPDATRRIVQDVFVPDDVNYVLQVTLWDGEVIVGRGEGRVQLLPTYTVDPRQEIRVSNPDISAFVRGDGEGDFRFVGGGEGSEGDASEGDYGVDAPGLPVLAGIAALAAIALARRRNA